MLPASVRKNLAVHVSLSSHLHNVKELTSLPSRAKTSSETRVSTFFREQDLAPVARRHARPFRNPPNCGSNKCSTSSAFRGYKTNLPASQHPFPIFLPLKRSPFRHPNQKARNLNCFGFQWLASVRGPVWRRALQRWAGYRGSPFCCQRPTMTKTTFSGFGERRIVENLSERPVFLRLSALMSKTGTFPVAHGRRRRRPPPALIGGGVPCPRAATTRSFAAFSLDQAVDCYRLYAPAMRSTRAANRRAGSKPARWGRREQRTRR